MPPIWTATLGSALLRQCDATNLTSHPGSCLTWAMWCHQSDQPSGILPYSRQFLAGFVDDSTASFESCAAINSSPPGQHARHFVADIFRCIFVNEKLHFIKISLKFIPRGPINNILTLVTGDKPLSEPMMVSLLTHIYASLGLNELTKSPVSVSACINETGLRQWQLQPQMQNNWLM